MSPDPAPTHRSPSASSSAPADSLGIWSSELEARLARGETISLEELREASPADAERMAQELQRLVLTSSAPSPQAVPNAPRDPHAGAAPQTVTMITEPPSIPEMLGRYQRTELLGAGGFGIVYKGWDGKLQRPVAIKVAHRLPRSASEADGYLKEAQLLADLDHPHIVPVYDVGQTSQGLVYTVSKYIAGADLARCIRRHRPDHRLAARLVAQIAEALDYAHSRGIVHRDVKPGNILLTDNYFPVLADFGLALRDADFGRGDTFVGTPTYMSPEQARREGHRVDGRCDIYSLGAVFYELLTGQRPFQADTVPAMLELIRNVEVRPPRQIDRSIPRELERICLKALSKRVADRYNTARDMAEELQLWHASAVSLALPPKPPSTSSANVVPRHSDHAEHVVIVPRGLRAFEASDADFFLNLLPGPRDREGLPESVRFWKTRIEADDADETFRVGVLLGPSGSGKSSLVRAGIVPHLEPRVMTISVETRPQDLEQRVLRRLQRHLPGLESTTSLHDALTQVRQGRAMPAGRKLLLVFDQFEQWLNHHRPDEACELVDALRQCDGAGLQALLLIRDDFTLAAATFMDQLEEPLSQSRNFATVELFSKDHGRKVLQALGRAFGALSDELPREQQRFVETVVEGLSEEGPIVPIQLALFAEMVKDKPWTLATLREYGGTRGMGTAFLEAKLAGPAAHPFLLSHAETTRRLLEFLLPDNDAVIKGRARTRQEIFDHLSRLARPDVIERILGLLDTELRLITPSGQDLSASSDSQGQGRQPAYQLTHDYLVPTIRHWLTAAERTSRRGRVRLRLRELADAWNAKAEARYLPTTFEWASIVLQTRWHDWTAPQRRMMNAASRRVVTRTIVALVALGLLIGAGYEANGRMRASILRDRLLTASTFDLPGILASLRGYQRWAEPLLMAELPRLEAAQRTAASPKDAQRLRQQRVHLACALLRRDGPRQLAYLQKELPALAPGDLLVAARLLRPHARDVVPVLWQSLEQQTGDAPTRVLAVASILTQCDPHGARWANATEKIIDALLELRPFELKDWIPHFQDAAPQLLPQLALRFQATDALTEAQRGNALDLLLSYAAGDSSSFLSCLEYVRPEELPLVLASSTAFSDSMPDVARQRFGELRKAARNAPDVAAQPAPASVLQLVADYPSRFNAQAGLAWSIPRAKLELLAAALYEHGYRPTCMRPYATATGTMVAAGWTRDRQAFAVEWLEAASDITARDRHYREHGMQICDIACCSASDPAHEPPCEFAVLWVTTKDEVEWYADVAASEHKDQEEFLRGKKFQLARYGARAAEDGHARCWAVWRRSADEHEKEGGGLARSRWLAAYGDVYPGYLQVDSRWETPNLFGREQRDLHNALTLYESARDEDGRSRLALVLIQLERFREALPILDELLESDQDTRRVLYRQALAYAGLGDSQQLKDTLARLESLQLEPFSLLELRIRLALLGQKPAAFEPLVNELETLSARASQPAEILAVTRGYCLAAGGWVQTDAQQGAQLRAKAAAFLRRHADQKSLRGATVLLHDPAFDDVRSLPDFQTALRMLQLDRYCHGAWIGDPGNRRSYLAWGLTPERHLSEAQRLLGEGYQPLVVEGDGGAEDSPLRTHSLWQRAVLPRAELADLARRQATLILVLARLGEVDFLFDALGNLDERQVRSYLVQGLPHSGVLADVLAEKFVASDSVPLRRALLMALSGYPATALSAAASAQLAPRLESRAHSAEDAGERALAEYCATQWGLARRDLRAVARDEAEQAGRSWYVTPNSHAMIIIEPSQEYLMGSRDDEPNRGKEQLGWVRVERSYALAATETTVAQFQQFLADPKVKEYFQRHPRFQYTTEFAPENTCPQISIRWQHAALYCQWLSEQEGLAESEWCYPGIWDVAEGELQLPPDYLDRQGYRLPTEAEWEYACRSGSSWARSYGDDDKLLGAYAWYYENSGGISHPVATRLPNEWGLFDMLGNAVEWCQEEPEAYGSAFDSYARTDREPRNPLDLLVRKGEYRVLRGGSYESRASNLRSADRSRAQLTDNKTIMGFRVARTVKSFPR